MRSIRNIWAPLTSCSAHENHISFGPIFLFKPHLGNALHRQGELSLICSFCSRGKERGEDRGFYACFLQEGKHLQVSMTGQAKGVSKKPPKSAMKLRKSPL